MNRSRGTELKRIMEHPVFLMHDNSAKIIRAQLFFLSISTILLVVSGIAIGERSSILGISVEGLTLKHVLWVLVCLILYQMLHFLWASWESFCEWRLRQSALDAGGWGGGGIKILEENEALKVRQTTLYSYMTYVLDSDLKGLHEKINHLAENGSEKELKDIESAINRISDAFHSPRIDDSMWRFDNWFKMFCKSQNWRWLLLEMLLPLVLGFVAIILSICSGLELFCS